MSKSTAKSFLQRHSTIKGSVTRTIQKERKHFVAQALELQGGSIRDWADTINFLRGQDAELDGESPMLYCNVTGQPIGQLSLEIVDMYRKSRKAPTREVLIDTLTLATQPAPHWLNRTPDTLRRNMELDPFGFLVYMVERSYGSSFKNHKMRPQGSKTWHWKSSNDCASWYRIKIEAYKQAKELDIQLIIRANRALAWVDAKLGLSRISMPFGSPLAMLDSAESLRIAIHYLSGYLEEYKNDESKFNQKYNPEPNRNVNSAIFGDVERASAMTQREFVENELTSLLMASLNDGSELGEFVKYNRGSSKSNRDVYDYEGETPIPSSTQVAATEMADHLERLMVKSDAETATVTNDLLVEHSVKTNEIKKAKSSGFSLTQMMQTVKGK